MQLIQVTAKVHIPPAPAHIILSDGQKLPLDAITDSGLREIGEAYGEQLVTAAKAAKLAASKSSAGEVFELAADAAPLHVWPPAMSKISAAGENQHSAVALPAYGLMFDATPPKLADNWQHAKQIASESRLLGFDDWRLPESHELALLIRHDRHKPAIDTEFFPHTPTDDWFWTNTAHASVSSFAWGVYFGFVNGGPQNLTGFVRAVRRVAVPASQ